MKTAVLILLCFVAAQAYVPRMRHLDTVPGAPKNPDSRIVNGQQATRGQFPHQVAITIDNTYFCGGSLISLDWVMTAGHCVDGSRSFDVTLGQQQQTINEFGKITLRTTDKTLHENYNGAVISNDIAVLRLPREVEVSAFIKPVNLPRRSEQDNQFVGYNVTASGWGKTSDSATSISDQLFYVNLNVIDINECSAVYGFVITKQILCCGAPGGIGTCGGDSGGALILSDGEPTQVGIVSFTAADGCEAGYPSGYTRVTWHLDWIQEKTGIQIQP